MPPKRSARAGAKRRRNDGDGDDDDDFQPGSLGTSSMPQNRRLSHNQSEQRRARRIAQHVEELKGLLSDAGISTKSDKASILEGSVSYIRELLARANADEAAAKFVSDVAAATSAAVAPPPDTKRTGLRPRAGGSSSSSSHRLSRGGDESDSSIAADGFLKSGVIHAIVDRDGDILEVNDSFLRGFNLRRGHVIGGRLTQYCRESDRTSLLSALRSVSELPVGSPPRHQAISIIHSATLAPYHCLLSPVNGIDGRRDLVCVALIPVGLDQVRERAMRPARSIETSSLYDSATTPRPHYAKTPESSTRQQISVPVRLEDGSTQLQLVTVVAPAASGGRRQHQPSEDVIGGLWADGGLPMDPRERQPSGHTRHGRNSASSPAELGADIPESPIAPPQAQQPQQDVGLIGGLSIGSLGSFGDPMFGIGARSVGSDLERGPSRGVD